MSDVAGIVLYSILSDPTSALAIWPKLKLQFFNSDYTQIYLSISKYYNKYQEIPSFESLKITSRDQSLIIKIRSLELLEVSEDIDVHIAVEALKDQYTQEETLEQLSTFVGNIVNYDSDEAKLRLAEVLQHVEEQTDSAEEVFLMNDIFLFDEDAIHSRVMLGLNNNFDAATGGFSQTSLVMFGGHRGSGKTVAACNIAVNQYNQENSCLFFSIEMRFREIFGRYMSILSGVDNTKIELNRCDHVELVKVAEARKDMFVDSAEVFEDFKIHKDYKKFELDLLSSKGLKANQIITIDNQGLSIADIDLNIQKFKAIHGDKLKTVVVDYVNQIQTNDLYDWKSQIMLSKKLKDLAAKHDVIMVSPYQTDTTGEARFAKGLLDAADVAISLTNEGDHIKFNSTKTRGMPSFEFNAPCLWDTLQIMPHDAIVHEQEESDSDKETSEDIGWGSI